ncbi:ferritin-like domain-containing protein [Pedobacter chinensis]|uniref:Ferritin-like domain-containing protein n=1 Tax=Pedobacter chinensis TaxID=2282421 RepID=A0A369Q2S3_9SPHI|nr:ferritin-like domain-containing protein [Pedobacter chinensis]RDC57326.1 ferritin-like domain-containing protein [Pedobacter chinensis]
MKTKETGSDPKFATKTSSQESPALNELFKDSISDLYWAENHLVKALPKMISAATAPELKNAIESHLEETKGHVSRLEQIFELLGEKAIAKKCDAMEGLTKEAEGIVEETEPGTATRDVGIILASQKVEHYEIASYGGLYQLATTLGLTDIADLLEQTLAEEKLADGKLTDIAENEINYKAADEA